MDLVGQKDTNSDEWKYSHNSTIPLQQTEADKRRQINEQELSASISTADYLKAREEDHIRIFASLVPDEVIYHINDYARRYFDACLLFGDVSGFTDLCEKYNKTGKGGPSKLTQVLNSYIGAMVQEILSHDGDVLKFSGDAFIAVWKVTENLSMKDAVHEAINCSLVIQKTYGRYQAEQDVVIRVKLAISAGPVVFSLLGDKSSSHYAVCGSPILEIKAAESLSFAGDIIITKAAWKHVSLNEYLAEELNGGVYVKIYGVGPNWRDIQRAGTYGKDNKQNEIDSDLSLYEDAINDDTENDEEKSDFLSRQSSSSSFLINKSHLIDGNDKYGLRPSVNLCIRERMLTDLKRFIIEPVERGIMADEPIEYLTEIRAVTILFINCKLSEKLTPHQILDVADKVYIIVSRIVKKQYGCLNKVNLFDKDLLVLVIFGLRGLKHEMESQMALKSAKECHESLMNVEFIGGVGIGVTTGKTYCGAFGHSLRREYTVISLIVNKAARLMVAYPNKVTCDRETFLHSKMEASNFILQEYKPLKGIINPGPIYEFKKIQRTRDVSLNISKRPLLGREQEIELYLHLYHQAKSNAAKDECFRMLLIQGESRQGKTGLLEELIYSTDPEIPINRFTLNKTDVEVPYTSIRLLFNPLLNLNEESTKSGRETKILKKLEKFNLKQDAYCLNNVFDVSFATPDAYEKMNNENKYRELKRVFRALCVSSFRTFWIIAIDNAEHIDDESWLLIAILIKLNLIFIIATMSLKSTISSIALEVLKMPQIKIIQMKCIDKWYHIGLACQMLDVEAIPAELEKVIQLRSNGNPGWVESFLISLLQSNGVYIRIITRKTAYERGLVIAPLYMMFRLSETEKNLWMEIMEDNCDEKFETRWKMYIDTCRESFPDLTIARTLADKFDLAKAIKVCVLNPSFNIDEVEPELSMDVIILKIFDALTSYEQLLLKCSAVLGDIFPRNMLMYIMSTSAVRLTALAVRKLFEIHVLCCARGNFVEGGLIFKERLKNPNEETEVVCECKGLIIEESCQDLPKYASCGYLRFISSTFRETTYNLLTHNQKREFHTKALRYLEKYTRKCRACGNGFFSSTSLSTRLDYNLRLLSKLTDKKNLRQSTMSLDRSSGYVSDEKQSSFHNRDSYSYDTRSIGSKYIRDAGGKSLFRISDSHMFYSHAKNIDEELDLDFVMLDTTFGLRTINKYKNDLNITRTFSDTDYSECNCPSILTTLYAQMIQHCSGAGLIEKMMNVMISYCYICVDQQNLPQALKILDEALMLLEGPMRQTIELEWKIRFQKGKLFLLMGYVRLELKQLEECYKHLQDALYCFGICFPANFVSFYLIKLKLIVQQDLSLFLFPKCFTSKNADDDKTKYYNDVAECLIYLCEYFLIGNQWQNASLAALWSLKYARWSETDFQLICMAYANMIHICTHFYQHRHNIALEIYAFDVCNRKRTAVDRDELKAIAKLYFSIFFARITRSEMEKSIYIGYLLRRIGTSTHSVYILLSFLPMLALAILMQKHIIDAGNIVQEIQIVAEEAEDKSGKSWYHGTCLCFHLETGYTIEPYYNSLTFAVTEGREESGRGGGRDPDALTRLTVSIWLRNVRVENWEGVIIWNEDVMKFEIQPRDTTSNLITALYKLEGLIIMMVKKMDRKNLQVVEQLNQKIKKLFKDLNAVGKYVKIILPRLFHLKAYYHIVKTNDYQVTVKLLKKAMDVSNECGNEMEMSWISHNELAWCNKLSRNDQNFWLLHSESKQIDYSYCEEYDEKFGHFSLPIPIYL